MTIHLINLKLENRKALEEMLKFLQDSGLKITKIINQSVFFDDSAEIKFQAEVPNVMPTVIDNGSATPPVPEEILHNFPTDQEIQECITRTGKFLEDLREKRKISPESLRQPMDM